MWDSAHWLQDAINNLLNEREQTEFVSILSDYHGRRCVRDVVFSLDTLLDTPAKRQLLPLLRHVIPKSDRKEFDRHTARILQAQPKKSTPVSVPGEGRNVYPKSVLKKSHSVTMGRDHYLSLARPSSSNSYIAPFSEPVVPTWDSPGIANQVKHIYMEQPSSQREGLGFSIRGGAEHGIGIYVSYVDVESIAERQGLVPGDQILSVNGLAFNKITHEEAARIIKTSRRLELEVRNVGRVPGSFETHQKYTWVDSVGRTVSPPPEVDRVGRYDTAASGGGQRKSGLMLLKDSDERKVNLVVSDKQDLGLMIRGGSEFGLGIYITGLDRNSVAENAGLKVGDQILDVNGTSFLDISHSEAVRVLRSCTQFIATIKDVGRVPYARTTYDHTQWMSGRDLPQRTGGSLSRSSSYNQLSRGGPQRDSMFVRGAGSQLMHSSTTSAAGRTQWGLLEERARHVLNASEQDTLDYYLHQYTAKHITVHALMLALLQLLNTQTKFSLTTEMRGLISPLDIEKFDRMVLEKRVDNLKGRSMDGMFAQDDRTSDNSLDSISSNSRYSNDSKAGEDEMEPLRRAIKAIRDDPPSPVHDYTPKKPPPPPPPPPEPPEPVLPPELPGQHLLRAVEGRDPISRDPIGREEVRRSQQDGNVVVAVEVHNPPPKPQFDDIRSPSEDSGVDVNGSMMIDPALHNGHARVTMSAQEPVIINEVLESLSDEDDHVTSIHSQHMTTDHVTTKRAISPKANHHSEHVTQQDHTRQDATKSTRKHLSQGGKSYSVDSGMKKGGISNGGGAIARDRSSSRDRNIDVLPQDTRHLDNSTHSTRSPETSKHNSRSIDASKHNSRSHDASKHNSRSLDASKHNSRSPDMSTPSSRSPDVSRHKVRSDLSNPISRSPVVSKHKLRSPDVSKHNSRSPDTPRYDTRTADTSRNGHVAVPKHRTPAEGQRRSRKDDSHIIKPLTDEDIKRRPETTKGKPRPSLPSFAQKSRKDKESNRTEANGEKAKISEDLDRRKGRRKITDYMLPDLDMLPHDNDKVLKTKSRSRSVEPNHVKVDSPPSSELDVSSLEKSLLKSSRNNYKAAKLKAVKLRKSSNGSSPVSVLNFSYSSDDLGKSGQGGQDNLNEGRQLPQPQQNHVPKSKSLDFAMTRQQMEERLREERDRELAQRAGKVRRSASTNRDNVYEEINYQQQTVTPGHEKIRVHKVRPTLGLAIEGGANTRQPLPRVIKVTSGGCADVCGRMKVGQTLVQINDTPTAGLSHQDVAHVIAQAFRDNSKNYIDFLVQEDAPQHFDMML